MTLKTAFVFVVAATSAGAWGCGSSSPSNTPTGEVRASLHRAKSCGSLLADLHADASFKLDKAIDRQIASIQQCILHYGEDRCAFGGYGYGYGAEPPMAAGSAEDAATGAPAPNAKGTPRATAHSDTNVQVEGVDEADIVKTDGANIYLLHGRSLKVLKAWPAAALAEASSIDLEGSPSEMFVSGNTIVVYSQVNGASLYEAAGVSPKPVYREYGYGYGYDVGGGVAVPAGAPESGATRTPGGSTPYVPLTKITVLTLSGTTPAVSRELYFEGSYLDSRRVDTHVRTVLADYAHGPMYKFWGPDAQPPKTGSEAIARLQKLRAENHAIIDASPITDWLPYTFVKDGATVTAKTIACEDFYVPTTGSTESGLTEVAAIDLANPSALPKETGIFGRADTVYAGPDTLYLAARAWSEPPLTWAASDGFAGSGSGGAPPQTEPSLPPPDTTTPAPEPAPAPEATPQGLGTRSLTPQTSPAPTAPPTMYSLDKTHVHALEFKTDPTFPNYVASGTVPGYVKDQFSLDDKDGTLRIATTESRMYVSADGQYVSPSFPDPSQPSAPLERPPTVNHVFTLRANGSWLDKVGDVGPLAPGERIYSVRFVGTRGYVTTFRQVDPLFVVDLAQPENPTVLAALKIPGFSEYMHPLDDNHLLTIGREASSTGRSQGIKLQIVDVTNGAAPVVTQTFTYSASEYGSSEAEYDHKAFTYFADRHLLAFPYTSYGAQFRSSLELFNVDVATGFTKLGSVDNTPLEDKAAENGYCGGYFGPQVRRGVFLDSFVYSISYGGVVVRDSNDLAAPVASLPLAPPTTDPGYGAVPACAYPAAAE